MADGNADTVTRKSAQLPGYWRFAWMYFMQPISLHYRLKECGIDEPNVPAWTLWMTSGENRTANRDYLKRMFLLFITISPMCGSIFIAVAFTVGLPVDVMSVAVGWALGVLVGLSLSGALGTAVAVVGGLLTFWSLGGVAGDVTVTVAVVVALIVAGGGGAIMAYLCVFLVPIELIQEFTAYFIQRNFGVSTLHRSPIFYHELSYIAIPFLQKHIVMTSEKDPNLVQQALDLCSRIPGQRRIAQRALVELQSMEILKLGREESFKAVIDLAGRWLPGKEGADPLLLRFSEAARPIAAAHLALNPYHKQKHLESAIEQLNGLKNSTIADDSPLARYLRETVDAWQSMVRDMYEIATEDAELVVENPFRAGDPLKPGFGKELFRGRQDLVGRIENLLAIPDQGGSIALLGPRRCGKSSLLQMLPAMIPDAICVFFDLQDNPVGSSRAFFTALANATCEQAKRDRQVDLPKLPEGPPFESVKTWLDTLEGSNDPRRILICIDEFERLEKVFPGDERELHQLMGLFRATIQHKRKVRLLISGAAPFDELSIIWSDYFISVRELRIGHLGREDSIDLLTKPTRTFPEGVIPVEVAEKVYELTNGLPFLLQIYGTYVVDHLNKESRRRAELSDLDTVQERVLTEPKYYYQNVFRSLPPNAQEALTQLAEGNQPQLDPDTRRRLRRRLLIDENDRINIPIFGEWIRQKLGSE